MRRKPASTIQLPRTACHLPNATGPAAAWFGIGELDENALRGPEKAAERRSGICFGIIVWRPESRS